MVIGVQSFPEYFESVSRNDTLGTSDEMPQISLAIWHIDRVVFYEIYFLLEVQA